MLMAKCIASKAWASSHSGRRLRLGFIHHKRAHHKVTMRDDLGFIRGNDDDPSLCRSSPRNLGEFGKSPDGLFWMSGAWSIDWQFRQEGVSWWRDEELSTSQLGEAFDCYVGAKPRVVVTHQGPASLFREGGEMKFAVIRKRPLRRR